MAVRIGQVSISQVVNAVSAADLDSAVLTASAYTNASYIISVFFGKDTLGNPLTINSWVFNPGVTNDPLSQIADANSDGIFIAAQLVGPTIDAAVRINIDSSGAAFNGILATILLYETDQTSPVAAIPGYYGPGADAHIQSEPSGTPNNLYLTFLGIDSTPNGSSVDKLSVNDGSYPFLLSIIDPGVAIGTPLLNFLVTAMNGDQYANREINITWAGGGRDDYWAFDAQIAAGPHFNVDIPGAIGVPGHIADPD